LAHTKWWGIAIFSTVSIAAIVGGFFWIFRRVSAQPDPEAFFGSPLVFLLIGLVVGLPFSLPSVITTWSVLRPAKVAARERKAKAATKADRWQFAEKLLSQIQEFSQTPREIDVFLDGKKGRVLRFQGDLEREEGDRLVNALRADLQDLDFERVEGEGPKGKWWSRV
jgi:hypothetical protein